MLHVCLFILFVFRTLGDPTPNETTTPTPTPEPPPQPPSPPIPPPVANYLFDQIIGTGTPVPPLVRQAFSMGLSKDRKQLVIIGGANENMTELPGDVWLVDMTTPLKWRKTENASLSLFGQCTVQGPKDSIFMFGGRNSTHPESRVRWWNFTTGNITELDSKDAPQDQGMYPACAFTKDPNDKSDLLWVYGGLNESKCSNDLRRWVRGNNTWTTISPNNPSMMPPPLQGASLVAYTDTSDNQWLALFGGYCEGQIAPSNQVWWYSIGSNNWTSDLPNPNAPKLMYHSAVVSNVSNAMIVFGGMDYSSSSLSQKVYLYDLNSSTWMPIDNQIPEDDRRPSARAKQSAVYSRNRILIYGGDTATPDTSSEYLWQFVLESDCKSQNNSCGECVLTGCVWCGPVQTSTPKADICIGGNEDGPYIASTCGPHDPNQTYPEQCRYPIDAPSWLVPVVVVVLVAIFALVIMTYIVDWKKGQQRRGYDYVS